jgi:hypothetical protein
MLKSRDGGEGGPAGAMAPPHFFEKKNYEDKKNLEKNKNKN